MSHPLIHFDAFDAELQLTDISTAFEAALVGIQDIPEQEKALIDAVMKDVSSEDGPSVRQHLERESWAEAGRAVDALCAAFFLAAYAVYEFAILRIIDNYFLETGSLLRSKDLGGTTHERFGTVKDRLARATLHNAESWTDQKPVQDVRNLLAHANGMAFNQDEIGRITKISDALPGTRIERFGESGAVRFIVEPTFTRTSIKRFVQKVRSANVTLTEAIKC